MLKGIEGIRKFLKFDWLDTTPQEPAVVKPVETNVNDLFRTLFLEGGDDFDNGQKAEEIISFLKEARAAILEHLPKIPEKTQEEMGQMFIDIILNNPIQDIPKSPHIDNAQLVLFQLHACVENRQDGAIEINPTIFENFVLYNETIKNCARHDNDLFRRIVRLSEFMGKSSQSTPGAAQRLVL